MKSNIQPIYRVLLIVALFLVTLACIYYMFFSKDFITVFKPESIGRLKQDAKAQLCIMTVILSITGILLLIHKSDNR